MLVRHHISQYSLNITNLGFVCESNSAFLFSFCVLVDHNMNTASIDVTPKNWYGFSSGGKKKTQAKCSYNFFWTSNDWKRIISSNTVIQFYLRMFLNSTVLFSFCVLVDLNTIERPYDTSQARCSCVFFCEQIMIANELFLQKPPK